MSIVGQPSVYHKNGSTQNTISQKIWHLSTKG